MGADGDQREGCMSASLIVDEEGAALLERVGVEVSASSLAFDSHRVELSCGVVRVSDRLESRVELHGMSWL